MSTAHAEAADSYLEKIFAFTVVENIADFSRILYSGVQEALPMLSVRNLCFVHTKGLECRKLHSVTSTQLVAPRAMSFAQRRHQVSPASPSRAVSCGDHCLFWNGNHRPSWSRAARCAPPCSSFAGVTERPQVTGGVGQMGEAAGA
ncbi:hypothetical protein E2C01_019907 [Portunus trituberculatus]|uniref:Uncharacterized protein n=1 Tax=Portunus trituberculatus TaxID=210409 RepID=A0A5B7DYV7_PORTR|nr:hypothetical protein [Portunus trituberculatus]